MTIKINCYSVLLLTAFTTLAGCQTTKTVPPQTTLQDENTMTMKAEDTDSDGDGVLDELDECPSTSNYVVDKRGCPDPLFPDQNSFKMEARAFYNENSSEIKSQYYEDLNSFY